MSPTPTQMAPAPIDICILNPPHEHIAARDPMTGTIARLGFVCTGNAYTALCELAWRTMRNGGQFAALTPRSSGCATRGRRA